jgi:hypothetical protein
MYIQRNQNRAGDANSQPRDVNNRIALVLGEIAKCDFQVVLGHGKPNSFELNFPSFSFQAGLMPIPDTLRLGTCA